MIDSLSATSIQPFYWTARRGGKRRWRLVKGKLSVVFNCTCICRIVLAWSKSMDTSEASTVTPMGPAAPADRLTDAEHEQLSHIVATVGRGAVAPVAVRFGLAPGTLYRVYERRSVRRGTIALVRQQLEALQQAEGLISVRRG